jgi:hypothetical protein
MAQSLYDDDGYMVIPAIRPDPIPLSVTNCNHVELRCTNRNFWRGAFHVVDARPVKNQWPVSKPHATR